MDWTDVMLLNAKVGTFCATHRTSEPFSYHKYLLYVGIQCFPVLFACSVPKNNGKKTY